MCFTMAKTCGIPQWDEKKMTYLIYKEEKGAGGLEHWQGYAEGKQMALSTWKKILPGAHIEARRGTQDQAIAYVQKPETTVGPIVEHGEKTHQGERGDLKTLVGELVAGTRTMRDVIIETPDMHYQYGRTLEAAALLHRPVPTHAPDVLSAWQQALVELMDPLNRRAVYWVWEPTGGVGKTDLTLWLIKCRGAVLLGGNHKDSFYAYQGQPMVVFNITRSCPEEYVPYDAFEAFKDGVFFSGKYESRMVVCKWPPIVLVLANRTPDYSKLSADRWVVRTIEDGRLV